MPSPDVTENFIRLRQRDPDDFVQDSFRNITLSESQGIHAVIGKLRSDPNGSTVIQSYLFEKDKWTVSEAQAWVKKHKESSSSASSVIERREWPGSEIRVEGKKAEKIAGYAAVFDSMSEEMWGFREKVSRGAFADSILSDDVRALWNHDPNYVLGRNRAGTLRLQEDDKGLYFEITPPDTQWARDLVVSIKRGDISQTSFGFQIVDEGWEKEDGHQVRLLQKVKLYDVSPVTYPAYPATEAYIRSKNNVYIFQQDKLFFGYHDPQAVLVPAKDDKSKTDVVQINEPLIPPAKWASIQSILDKRRK